MARSSCGSASVPVTVCAGGTEEAESTTSLCVRSLGGQETCLHNLGPATTVAEVKKQLADILNAHPMTLRLIACGSAADGVLDDGSQTLPDLGLDIVGAFVTLVRTSGAHILNEELLKAVREGRNKDAVRLVDQGAGLDLSGMPARDDVGSTILHLAVREGLVDLAAYLVQYANADVHAVNEMGRQPLSVAAIMRQEDVVELLLESGADPFHKDSNGRPAHFYAVQKGLSPSLCQRLDPLSVGLPREYQV